MEEMTTLITNVGFPIVACIFMYTQINKLNEIILNLCTTLKGIDARLDKLEKENNHVKNN